MCNGQNFLPKVHLYESWYYMKPADKEKLHVYTYAFQDSTVSYVRSNKYVNGAKAEYLDIKDINIKDIEQIKVRRKGAMLTSVLGFGAFGFFTGIIVGSQYKHYNPDYQRNVVETKNLLPSVLIGTAVGIGIGFSFGSIRKTYKIKGDAGRYDQALPKLEKSSIKFYIP